MQAAFEQLSEFHDMGHIKRTGSRRPHFAHLDIQEKVKLLELRQNLVKEETEEFDEALNDYIDSLTSTEGIEQAREHLVKELCDALYVLVGTAVDLDIDLARAFTKVHLNNVKKITTCTVRDDGKLVKAKDHPSCDLKGF